MNDGDGPSLRCDDESWELVKRLFEETSVGVLRFRRDMSVAWVNRAGAEMLGDFRPRDLIGRVLFDRVPWMRERKPIYDRVLEGESIDMPGVEIAMDGVPKRFDLHYRPVYDARRRVTGLTAIVCEITRQEQVKRELMRSEERFQTLYDATPDMLLAVALPSKTIVECNEMFCENLGYARQDVVGKPLLDFYHPDSVEEVDRVLARLLRDGTVRGIELRVLRKDGTAVDIELNSSAFHDATGEVVGTRAVWHDITERKQALEKLRRSEEQLRDLSNRTLDAQEAERKQIAREFHDEVGQIFTGLRLELAWVRSRLGEGQADVEQKIVSLDGLIADSVRRVRRIASALRPELLDTLGLVPAIEWQVGEFEERSGIPCELKIHPPDLVVEPDAATVIFRIVQEALTNVVRHSKATRSRIVLRQGADGLVLEVDDDGAGVDVEQLAQGKSLGLRGMKERALLVGGRLAFSSSPSGTKLTVRIPRS